MAKRETGLMKLVACNQFLESSLFGVRARCLINKIRCFHSSEDSCFLCTAFFRSERGSMFLRNVGTQCGKAEDRDINHHRCKTSCLVGLYFCPKTALHMKVVTRFYL